MPQEMIIFQKIVSPSLAVPLKAGMNTSGNSRVQSLPDDQLGRLCPSTLDGIETEKQTFGKFHIDNNIHAAAMDETRKSIVAFGMQLIMSTFAGSAQLLMTVSISFDDDVVVGCMPVSKHVNSLNKLTLLIPVRVVSRFLVLMLRRL